MRYPRFVKSGIWFLIISLSGVITAPLQPEESNSGSAAILNTFPIQKDELFTASIQYPSLTSNKNSGESKLLRKKRKGATAPTIPETTLSTDEFTRVDTQDKLDDTSLSLAIGEEIICDKGLDAASSRHNSNSHKQLTLQPFIGYSDSSSSLQSAKVKLPLPESDKASKSLPPSAPPSESFVQTIRKRTTADETNPRAKEATVWQDPTDVKPTTKEEGNNKNTIATPTHGKADESRPTVYKSVQDDLEAKPGEKMLPVSPRNPGGEVRVRWHIICEPMERMLAKFYEGYFPRQHESWWRARLDPGYDLAGDFRAFEARCRTQPCACRAQGTWATRFTCVNPEGDINLSLSQMQTLSSTCRRRHGCRCEAEGYTDPPDPPIPQPVDEPSNFQGGLREPGARANEAYWSTVNKAFSDFSNYRSGNRQYTHEQHGVMESLPTESYLAPGTKEPFYLSGPEGYREVAPWSSFTDLRSVQGLGSTLSKRSAGSESGDKSAEQDEASQEPR
ncbi:hypothetical protein AOL_s00169g71 [Orbilia oligospora ATCC 24927]|uniref:Uncharacterized protein n=1 Tax=Arthrobotrys oligospora (strain ATCC 24927 / CBS 115.81 / DSM 1491) TaxID=756982 RepID=G1XML8_ARTOA|nr:hypothetical protein AOL_s00169g71 [Orbilia oligospora ATCC 24927]EGX45465.1 hypothetical protein AOL_s00169g71 [Orbilia oligospora ATCC 24927]